MNDEIQTTQGAAAESTDTAQTGASVQTEGTAGQTAENVTGQPAQETAQPSSAAMAGSLTANAIQLVATQPDVALAMHSVLTTTLNEAGHLEPQSAAEAATQIDGVHPAESLLDEIKHVAEGLPGAAARVLHDLAEKIREAL